MAKADEGLRGQFTPLIRRALRIVVVIIGTLTVLATIGVNITGLVALGGVLGLAFSMGSQDSVANLVGTINILQEDNAQFIQNFLTVVGLLFSILAGNAYSALYQQQESIYFALFQEVSEAKSLVEQTTLVCQGRPFYQSALACMRDYVKNDLRRLDIPPAKLLSSRPAEDPLESIM